MAIEEIKCPACGAPLSIPEGATSFTCGFCGASLKLSMPSPQGPAPEADGTVRDQATGQGLFRAQWPDGWQLARTQLQQTNNASRPYMPQVGLQDGTGSLTLMLGAAGVRRSKAFEGVMAMYGGHLAGVDRTNYAEMPDPVAMADTAANTVVQSMGGGELKYIQQVSLSGLDQRQQETLAWYKQYSDMPSSDPFVAEVLRFYSFSMQGNPWYIASYLRLGAVKQNLGGLESGALPGMGNFMDSLGSIGDALGNGLSGIFGQGGSALAEGARAAMQSGYQFQDEEQYQGLGGFIRGGGLVGKMRRQHKAAQQAAPAPHVPNQAQQPAAAAMPAQQVPSAEPSAPAWSTHDQASYTRGGTISWGVELCATMIYPAQGFEEQLNRSFVPLIRSVQVHPDVMSLTMQYLRQQDAAIQNATQGALAQSQANFQAQQAAHRQVQAAYDSANAAWQARSDSQHRLFRQQSNAQFNGTSGTGAPDYSEAIRGVNTYTTSDGREVEVSVHADRAWENQAGDVIGTSGSAEPGADWTEIPRQ